MSQFCTSFLNLIRQFFNDNLLARLFFKEKKSRYCHHSGVVVRVGGGVVLVVTNFNLGYNFLSVILWNFICLFTITRATIWPRTITLQGFLTKLCSFLDMKIGPCVDYRSVNSLWQRLNSRALASACGALVYNSNVLHLLTLESQFQVWNRAA